MRSFPMSPSEYVFQAVANALPPLDLEEILEELICGGELDQKQLYATHLAYPSILPEEMYESLLPHFEA